MGSLPAPENASPVRAAVVGVGHFGLYHAEKYARLDGVRLAAVVDIDIARAREVGERHDAPVFADYRAILDSVDAVSIATPATTHYEIAKAFLARGCHVLVEKPIAISLAEADELIHLARRNDVVLQVGHQERYFVAELDLPSLVRGPRKIVCRRTGPFTGRGTDCNVVLDMMIHDIDLVHQIVQSPPDTVTGFAGAANGIHEDEAEATIGFANGCTVRLFASRVCDQRERSIRIVSAEGTLDVDFIAQTVEHRRNDLEAAVAVTAPGNGADNAAQDLVAKEIAAFVTSVRTGAPPIVGGEDGRRALKTALSINRCLRAAPSREPAEHYG